MLKNKKWLVLFVLVMAAAIVSACAAPEPEQVVVTIEVEGEGGETVVITATPSAEEEVEETPEETEEPMEVPQGAWVDTIVLVEEFNGDAAISRLETGDLDMWAYGTSEAELVAKVEASDALEGYKSFGSYGELLFNPAGPEFADGRLNPFYSERLREAMNWLVDREFIVNEIFSGNATARYVPINAASADAARYADLMAQYALEYGHNPEAAEQVIAEEMEALGAEMQDGVWTYNGEPVEIIGLIRTEDERQEIGDYFAGLLEDQGFTVVRDFKTSSEASPCWVSTDPTEGCFSYYTGGWISTAISRDAGGNFQFFYSPNGLALPVWLAFENSEEFEDVMQQLVDNSFTNFDERRELFVQALDMALAESHRIWIYDAQDTNPQRAELSVAADLSAGVYGAQLWAPTIRREGEVGGSLNIATNDILTEPWNPVNGSNWVYDGMPQNATMDRALYNDPYTGLPLPNRVERAEVTVQEGSPVVSTLDWVTLEFADEITVPEDAWVDWDAETQTFITLADLGDEAAEDAGTAITKSVVYYPEGMFDSVTWHDGSPLSPADFVMNMIIGFDQAKEASAIYDESTVGVFESFMSSFKGMRIVSTDPLVIEHYSDALSLDAENIVTTWWPQEAGWYAYGAGAWHNMAPAIRAEAEEQTAFSPDKADTLEVDRVSFIGGPTLEIMKTTLDTIQEESWMPYEATLSQFISEDELATRYANLQEWYRVREHFWLGTGPFYLQRVFPVEGTLILERNTNHPDPADKWARFGQAPIPEVEVSGEDRAVIGDEASFDVNVTFNGEPYAAEDVNTVTYLVFDATGALAGKGEAESAGDGVWTVTLDAETTAELAEGSNQLAVVVASNRVALPVSATFEFVTVP